MHKKSQSAFTLLELLVVIGIISILITMGFASYSTAQKKARDAKRKGDLNAIQNAYEQYYSVCGFTYPALNDKQAVQPINCADPVATIMPSVPVDPLTTPYICNGTCDGSEYNICIATLESENTPAGGYCITNRQ